MGKTLVTGGAGFIGSHLVDRLLDEGHSVIVIDDLSSGKAENVDVGATFIKGDINDTKLNYLYEEIDTVFHLAALTRPQKSIKEPMETNHVNITGTLNVLIASRDAKVKRVVYASSSSLYGEQDTYPTSELAKPNPMSPYALQKYLGEQYCDLFQKLYGLESNRLRFFNVYGSRQDPNGHYACVIPKFISIMRAGGEVEIYGTGEQARDFTHVDDIVDGIMLASTSDIVGEVFNLGRGDNCSINKLFKELCDKMKYNKPAKYGPAMIEPTQTLANNYKARRWLGWEPKVNLSEGLERMLWE
jgi:nucleoside-diphosphate-sugar epimerase